MVDISSSIPDNSPGPSLRSATALWFCLLAVVCAVAIALRLGTHEVPWRTPDEKTYISYATQVAQSGPGVFRTLVDDYNKDRAQWLYPPPLRVGYVLLVAETSKLFGTSPEKAGAWLALAFSFLGFLVAALIGSRFFDRWTALIALAFLSVSPVDLAVARRAWADCVVSGVGILLFYLCLEASVSIRPNKWRLAFWIVGIYFLITKEFAICIYAFCVLWLLVEAWLQRRSWKTLAGIAIPSALTVVGSYGFLIWIAGGLESVLQVYHHLGPAHTTNEYVNLYQRGPWYSFPLAFWVLSPFTMLFAGVGIGLIVLRQKSLAPLLRSSRQNDSVLAVVLFVLALLAVATVLPGFKSMRFISVVAGPIYLIAGFLISDMLRAARGRLAPATFYAVTSFVAIALALICARDFFRFERIFIEYQLDDTTVSRIVNFAFAADSGWAKAPFDTFSSSDFPEYQVSRSIVLYNQGRYAEAIEACQNAIKARPDYAEAWNNICAANNRLGRYEDAATACEIALRIKPDFDLARNNLRCAKEHCR